MGEADVGEKAMKHLLTRLMALTAGPNTEVSA
jgi:hypothetical protein